jgi:Holliday junction resolvasome RuvABC DNA-binding subunit
LLYLIILYPIVFKGKLSHLAENTGDDTTLEVRLALEALGYSAKEIHDALKNVQTEGKSTSVLIKEALQQLQ